MTPYPGESALTAILIVFDLRICARWLSATAPVVLVPPAEVPPEEQPPTVRANAIAGTRSNFGVALNMGVSWKLWCGSDTGGVTESGGRLLAVVDHIGIVTII
jgi:hypothetical protein